MANDDFPQGLVPINTNGKGSVDAHYYLVSTAADLAKGMPVHIDANGRCVLAGGTGMITCLGVITGFSKARGGINHELDPFLDVSDLSSDDWYALVADDPSQEFMIQGDTGGTAIAQTDFALNADLLFRATSINTTTGWANLEIDDSTINSSTARFVQVYRFHGNINADGTENGAGDYHKLICRILHHQKTGVQAPSAQ